MIKTINNIPKINSGSIGIDSLLNGGYLSGRIIEISGQESSGKSSLALHAIKQLQNQNKLSVYIDIDGKISTGYLDSIGINSDHVIFVNPMSLEEAENIMNKLLRLQMIDLIVVDNVSNLVIEHNMKSKIIDYNYSLQNSLFKKFIHNLSINAKINNTSIVFINQYRTMIGSGYRRYLPLYSNIFNHFASTRISLKKISTITSDLEYIGDEIQATIHKSPESIKNNKIKFDMWYKSGINNIGEILKLAEDLNIVSLSGSWFKYGDKVLGQGARSTKEHLTNNIDLLDSIIENIIKKEKKYEFIRQYTVR